MRIEFEQEYLVELYKTGKCSDKKHRYQPNIVKLYISRVKLLESVTRIEDLFAFNTLNYEALKGDKKGIESIRINAKYRLEFITRKDAEQEPIITVCTILDITNHYK